MKSKILTFVCLFVMFLIEAQSDHVQTESVLIDNLITFIVDNIETRNDQSGQEPEHLIFLLQTPVGDLSTEDKVILKQAFKLVSKKLSTNDHISVITYSGINGIALNNSPAKALKDIIFTIENLSASVKEKKQDGIELAYTFAEASVVDESNCTILMVRNPKVMIARSDTVQNAVTTDKSNKNSAVLLTAISLLPQLISVIKD